MHGFVLVAAASSQSIVEDSIWVSIEYPMDTTCQPGYHGLETDRRWYIDLLESFPSEHLQFVPAPVTVVTIRPVTLQ